MGCEKEMDNKNIVRLPEFDYTPDPRGLGYVYYVHMLKHKDKLAQIFAPTGEEETYGELLQRCVRTAITMRKYGVTSDDFVSMCTFNHLNSSVPPIASLFIGAKMACVDPTMSVEDTIHLLKQVTPKLIFVLPKAVEMIEKVVEGVKADIKIVVFGETTKHIPFADFYKPSDEEASFKPYIVKSLKEPSIIFFTSGSTGLPKPILVDHDSMLCQAENSLRAGYCSDLIFTYASPYWSMFSAFMGVAIVSGTARLLYPGFNPNDMWRIFDYKVTLIILNTIQIMKMLAQGRPKHLDISSVKDILIGGAALSLHQMMQAKEMFPETRVHAAYGQTEVPGPLTMFKPGNPKDLEMIDKKPASSGTGLPGMDYKIVDTETEEILGPNQKGELRVKTTMQLSGYYKVDSSGVWDADGWLRTGDIAYYDEDHCFYIVDRIKEMFKFQCWHIAPLVLESVLLTHPAVELAVVIGKPHEIDGDHPLGIVILKPSHKGTTPEEIEKYVEAKVQDRQRLRAGVKFIDSCPLTASGKINRKKLKQMVMQGEI